MIIKRIGNFYQRNKEHLLGSLLQEVGERAYTLKFIREMLYPFITSRHPNKWVFVLGCYNSGTTILREILGAHPDISTLPREGVRFTSALTRPEDLGWTRMWMQCPKYVEMSNGNASLLVKKIIRAWSPWWDKQATIFLEKSITNVLRIKWLEQNFSSSYFIGITRNGYCVAEGIKRRAMPKGEPAKKFPNGYPISMTAQQWMKSNEKLLKESKTVSNYMQIKYEDLVNSPDAILNSIWNFLEIKKPQASFDGSRLEINKRVFFIINGNERSLSNLSEKDIESITPVISEMQKELGYDVLVK